MVIGNHHKPKRLTVQHGLITTKHFITFLTLGSYNYREDLRYPETGDSGDSKLSSWYIFPSEVPGRAPVIAIQTLYCIFSSFWWNYLL